MSKKILKTNQTFAPLHVVSFPFRASNLGIVALFVPLFSWIEFSYRTFGVSGLALTSGLLYVCYLIFFGYLFVVLEYTARGHQQVPMLSGSLVYEARGPLFKAFLLASAMLSIVYVIDNPYWQLFAAIFMLLLLPIATSILIMYDSFIAAITPAAWYQVLRHLRPGPHLLQYLLFSGLLMVAVHTVINLNWGWYNPLKMVPMLVSLLWVFRSFGAILNDHANELGLQIDFGEHISQQQAHQADQQAIADFLYDMHKLVSGGKRKQAMTEIQQRIKASNYTDERAYFEQLQQWQTAEAAIAVGRGYVGRLLTAGDLANAWRVLEFCYDNNVDEQGNQGIRLTEGRVVLELARHLRSHKQNRILLHLLSHFGEDFEGHPRAAEACLLGASVAAEAMNDGPLASIFLNRFATEFPQQTGSEEYQRLQALLP